LGQVRKLVGCLREKSLEIVAGNLTPILEVIERALIRHEKPQFSQITGERAICYGPIRDHSV
jgi:hypothetical protein